jgi:hypothetical protein
MVRRISPGKRWGRWETCGLVADGKVHQAGPDLYYATQEHWVVGFGEEEQPMTQLALVFEVLDMLEATGEEEFEKFPLNVEASLMIACPGYGACKEAHSEYTPDTNPEGALFDVYQYFGGVPVTHHLLGIRAAGTGLKRLPASEVIWKEAKAEYGTVAAQRGPGAVFRYPMFATEDAALQYIDLLAKRAPGLMATSGFILDMPVNLMGETGWNVLEKQFY